VRLRLISDVPLGAHLSGGIDSSIIVALMAETSSQPVKTFSVGFEDEAFSELQYARLIAERYATEHHEFILTYGDVPATLEQLVRYLGEPLGDPSILPLYHLSRLTRQFVTVALNGDGGDEAFAGYQRYWLDPWANRYLRLPGLITRGILPALVHYLPDHADLPIGGSLANGFKRLEQIPHIDPRASILRWGSYFSPRQKSQLWKPDQHAHLQVDHVETLLTERFEQAPAETFLDRTLYTDISTYLPGDLLVKADRMTMASSLEGRSPFLDHELAAWVARLPGKMKVRGLHGKILLRKTFANMLPKQIQRRGKQGFGIPVSTWFRGPLVGWTREVLLNQKSPIMDWFNPEYIEKMLLEHISGRTDHGKRLWALAVLGTWSKAFVWDLR
jgi:asparagine synthase (glutamine-hydrolysing)